MPPDEISRHLKATPLSNMFVPKNSVASGGIDKLIDGYAVVVVTPEGKHFRRIMLSLHAAEAAVKRAHDRGQRAELFLCRLVPVTGGVLGE